ncbi:peptide chain release factor 2 [Candidatus Uhrbacteria bacterium]|nr:peptide chain release factor 2 [Candidatus Uhrbacteria bacterium]
MIKPVIAEIEGLMARIRAAWDLLDMERLKAEIDALEWETQQPDFWGNSDRAQVTSRKLAGLRDFYDSWAGIGKETEDLLDFARMASDEVMEDRKEARDQEENQGIEDDIVRQLSELTGKFERLEFTTLLGEEYDSGDAIVAIHAGAGGTEAMDWAEMLKRMYFRYAEIKGWTVKILDESRGDEAGIKSVTFGVGGRFSFGHLKCEAGVHRLVRQSPFNADNLRQTSFALVEVLPDLGEVAEVEINPEDLRIDTYLSGGHGGQGVQTTYSAVRLTHLPTNTVVTCQNERSQTQNKETAMRILSARLQAMKMREREAERLKLRGEFKSAEWGNQIRSYVLHPYHMVKDHRTKFEVRDQETDRVLDGDLDPFVEAYLRLLKKGE